MAQPLTRDDVFVAGGQPSVTYIDRKHLGIERELARALAAPNQVVSLAGPTKSGKTVLCRHVLGDRQYVWIEGGQINTAEAAWAKICHELNFPVETTQASKRETGVVGAIKGMIFSASGSQLNSKETARTFRIDTTSDALRHLAANKITSGR